MKNHFNNTLRFLQQTELGNADEKRAATIEIENAEKELLFSERETRLEEALERLRSKTMKMRTSQDISETAGLMFDELARLGVSTVRCGIALMNQEYMQMELWTANIEGKEKTEFIIGRFDVSLFPMFRQSYHSLKNKEEVFSYMLRGDELTAYYEAVNRMPDYPRKYDMTRLPAQLFHYAFHFNEGTIFVFSTDDLSPNAYHTCQRFSIVFGQTYRRYLDLREVEDQKKEVEIKNRKLQETIDELTITKVSRKAKVITLLLAIVLMFAEEPIASAVLNFVGEESFLLNMTVKIVIVLSLKPIDQGIEAYLLRRLVLKKKKKIVLVNS